MTSSRKDPEFGDKLDHLEGVLGSQLPALNFRRSHQAEWIDTTPQQFSRKCKGAEAVSNRDLSKLIDLFQLGENFDYRLFGLEFEAFSKALSEAKVGSYGGSTTMRHRQILLEMADPEKPIAICLATSKRAGGIGGAPIDNDIPQFRIHDRVYLHIPLPGDGYLIVLNDNPEIDEITCLMPSQYSPDTAVKGNSLRVPTEQSLPYLSVTKPTGFYRLFAIWSATPIVSHLPDLTENAGTPSVFSTNDMEALTKMAKYSEGNSDGLRIMTADYRVT